VKKAGRTAQPLSVEEQEKLDERTEFVRQWVTAMFSVQVETIMYCKRGKLSGGQYYEIYIRGRFCFNKGKPHDSNASYIIVSLAPPYDTAG
jgi:hypothetical protein